MPRDSSDSFISVRGPGCRINFQQREATPSLCREGRGALFGTAGAFGVSIGRYNAMWAKHLELKGSVVRRYIKSDKCGSSKQCVIATAERDDIED